MSNSIQPESFGKLSYFLSHAWSNNFGKLVEIVCDLAEKEVKEGRPEPFFWIDCIAINQHRVDSELENLGNVLRDAVGTVAVCDPWDKPVAVSRSWCLYEFLTTIQSKREFIVALSREQQAAFVASLVENFDSVDRWISRVDARAATASVPADKTRIDAAIDASVGFGRLNETVQVALKRWLAESGEAALARLAVTHGSVHPRVLALQASLGMMLRQQQADRAALGRAAHHCGAVLEARRAALGESHPDTLAALAAVGMVARARGERAAALVALRAAADGLAAAHGRHHPAALRAANDLAFTLKAAGELVEAEAALRDAMSQLDAAVSELQQKADASGGGGGGGKAGGGDGGGWQQAEARPVTLVPDDVGDVSDGADAEADAKRRLRLLDDLQDLRCSLLSNLGGVAAAAGRHGEAVTLLEAAWEVKQTLKGAKHPSTLMTAADVAMARHAKATAAEPAGGADVGGESKEAAAASAAALQREVLASCVEVLGGEHRHSAMLMNNLAVMGAELRDWRRQQRRRQTGSGKVEVAEPTETGQEREGETGGALFERSYRAYMRSRGPGHPCTMGVLLNWSAAEAADAAAAAAAPPTPPPATGHGQGVDADADVDGDGWLPPQLRRLAAHVREQSEAREALQAAGQVGLLRALLAEPGGGGGVAHKSFHVRALGGTGELAVAIEAAGAGNEDADEEDGALAQGEGLVAAVRAWLLVSMAANVVLLRESPQLAQQ